MQRQPNSAPDLASVHKHLKFMCLRKTLEGSVEKENGYVGMDASHDTRGTEPGSEIGRCCLKDSERA